MKTVRYNNQKWFVDAETKTLYLENDKKTRVDIDEIWDELSDADQNFIAEELTSANSMTDEEMELAFEESEERNLEDDEDEFLK